MKKIYLFGRHKNRTPFAYEPYREMLENDFQYVDDPLQADFLVAGFFIDIRENVELLGPLMKAANKPLIVILSEEPLWDSLWSGNFYLKNNEIVINGNYFPYTSLNHSTTNIYSFRKIPYFVTTNDEYFVRYSSWFERNSLVSGNDLKEIWAQAPIRLAFYAERRLGEKFSIRLEDLAVYGLSDFRSTLAGLMSGVDTLAVGKGWGESVIRQYLPDWHLDKMASLDRKTKFMSALENTHQIDYVSEKIFDAYAALSVPIYYSTIEHSVNKIASEGSFINLFGRSAEESVAVINNFETDTKFVQNYLEGQAKLAETFSSIGALVGERKRVVREILTEFSRLTPNR